jgi:carboxylesterase
MRPFAETLHRQGWTVHALLLPGFGPDINTLAQRRYEEWLDHVIQQVNAHRTASAAMMLVGFSMGGALAISAAARLKPDALILLAPFLKVNHRLWTLLPVIQRLFPTFKPFKLIKPDFDNPEFRAGITRFMPGLDLDDPQTQEAVRQFELPVKMLAQIRKAGMEARKHAVEVTCPTLVIQGTQDTLVTPDNTQALIALMSDEVQYVEVPAEHELYHRNSPAWPQIVAALTRFSAAQIDDSAESRSA